MTVKRVIHYKDPKYPLKKEILKNPLLLEQNIPAAWKSTRELTGVAALFLWLGSTGCSEGKQKKDTESDIGYIFSQNMDSFDEFLAREDQELQPPPAPPPETIPTMKDYYLFPYVSDIEDIEKNKPFKTWNSKGAPAVAAPIFEHGEGHGSVGCVVITPPVFLSEEEALKIIRESLAGYGLDIRLDQMEITDIEIPPIKGRANELELCKYFLIDCLIKFEGIKSELEKLNWELNDFDLGRDAKTKGCKNSYLKKCHELEKFFYLPENKYMVIDGFDNEKKVAIEFVSANDRCKFTPCPEFNITAWGYNTKEYVNTAREFVEQRGKGFYFGAFYDPATVFEPYHFYNDDEYKNIKYPSFYSEKDYELWEKKRYEENRKRTLIARKKSIKDLKAQVKDFADWLKAQGVI
jgi:hypothetical protein